MDSLNTILARAVSYMNVSGAQAEWRRFIMFPAVPLSSSGISHNLGQNLIPNLTTGWETYRIYDPYDYRDATLIADIVNMSPLPEWITCTYDNVATLWNWLNPGLVFYFTHSCSIHAIDVLGVWGSINNVARLNGNFPAIVFAASCHTVPPVRDEKDPIVDPSLFLGYQVLYKNAISYIGAT